MNETSTVAEVVILVEFLEERIAEDEESARVRFVSRRMIDGEMRDIPIRVAPGAWAWPPDRVLADCAAKRRIVNEHRPRKPPGRPAMEPGCLCCSTAQIWDKTANESNCRTLCLLALPYADHDDYRKEWQL